tara:strand:- start:3446 stop:4312 length:867 start_codon:yes stop_codon:yes gene_type:complete
MNPNFFIVGAAKCGTTSMWQYLKQHPKIFMCNPKEPTYFSEIITGARPFDKRKPTWKEYLGLFTSDNDEIIFGDASPGYLVDPSSAEKIHEKFPNSKILIFLRDPVKRAYSHFIGTRPGDPNKPPFNQQLEYESVNLDYMKFTFNDILIWGLYYEQVKRYLDTFGPDNVKVMIYEDIFPKNIDDGIREILLFLGLDGKIHDYDPKVYAEYFVPNEKVLKIMRQSLIKNFSSKVIPRNIKESIYVKLRGHDGKKPKILTSDEEFLKKFYKNDVLNLERLLKRDLPWKMD